MLLTPRQTEVLKLWAEGYEFKEIAFQLHVSVKTAESHKASGMARLGFSSRVELIRYALQMGWIKKNEPNCEVG